MQELMVPAKKDTIVFGMSLGPAPRSGGGGGGEGEEEVQEEKKPAKPTRVADVKSRVSKNAACRGRRSRRTVHPGVLHEGRSEAVQDAWDGAGCELSPLRVTFLTGCPGLKLLGFKDRSELRFEDNVKHSLFIYPNEDAFNGSTRTFTALLQTLAKKDKIGLVVGLTRSNSSPAFYAMVPQEEVLDQAGAQTVPPGFHLICIPFADDIRSATVEKSEQGERGGCFSEGA